MLASVKPPAMRWAIACAIAVSGVTATPFTAAPAAIVGSTAVIMSPGPMAIGEPVASSV